MTIQNAQHTPDTRGQFNIGIDGQFRNYNWLFKKMEWINLELNFPKKKYLIHKLNYHLKSEIFLP